MVPWKLCPIFVSLFQNLSGIFISQYLSSLYKFASPVTDVVLGGHDAGFGLEAGPIERRYSVCLWADTLYNIGEIHCISWGWDIVYRGGNIMLKIEVKAYQAWWIKIDNSWFSILIGYKVVRIPSPPSIICIIGCIPDSRRRWTGNHHWCSWYNKPLLQTIIFKF